MQENILNNQQRQVLLELVRGDSPIDMAGLVDIFRSCTWKNPLDIFMSSDFFEVIRRVYRERYDYLPFTDFLDIAFYAVAIILSCATGFARSRYLS